MKKFLLAVAFLASFLFIPLAHASVEISDGSVVGLWHLDGDSADASGSGYHGADSNMAYSPGLLGDATEFLAGSSRRIDLPNFSIATASIAFWFRGSYNSGGRWISIDQSPGGSGDSMWVDMEQGKVCVAEVPSYSSVCTTETFDTANWHLIVVTKTDGDVYSIYADNASMVTADLAANNVKGGDGNAFGYDRLNGVSYQTGLMDEVVLFNAVIDASTREALWNNGNGQPVCVTTGCGGGPAAPSITRGTLQQYRSDASSTIPEGGTTIEDTVVVGATIQSSSTNPLRLEAEYTTSTFTGIANATSPPVGSGSQATTTLSGLADGQYHWRARAVDTVTNAVSSWQEFGTPGNVDFFVYTQGITLFHQTDDTSASFGSHYSDNWYQLGTGFFGTIHALTLRGYVYPTPFYASHIYLDEFNDANYANLNQTFTLSDNAPFTDIVREVTLDNLNIALSPFKFYRLRTDQDHQNRSVILMGTTATGTAMFNTFVSGTGRVESYYPFYPYMIGSDILPPASLGQFAFDGVTPIAEGGTTNASTTVFSMPLTSPPDAPIRLEVEVRPAGTPFTGILDSGMVYSPFATSGVLMASKTNQDGLWRWRARLRDEGNRVSGWTEFGTPNNTDFIVRTAPPSDPAVLVEQTDGSVSMSSGNPCYFPCQPSNLADLAQQIFTPLRSGTLDSIEVFTSGFSSGSANPGSNTCVLRLYDHDTNTFIAQSDNGFAGGGCAGDLTFSFTNSAPSLQLGTHYRWHFLLSGFNTSLHFLGSPNNVVDGIFSPPGPVVNAKFTVRSAFVREPVIIVPGILGSRLNRVSDNSEVWPSVLQMLGRGDAYLDDLSLNSAGQQINGKEMSATDVLRRELFFPFDKTFYKNLIDSFANGNGDYEEGRNLFVDPYDWRSDIGSSMNDLGSKILQAVSVSPTGKVNIIAHSMGGLLLKKYLSTLQDTSFIDKLVFVGVPQLGAPRAFKALNYGDNLDISILNADEVRKISQNMPSIYQLLPSRRYVQIQGSYIQDFRSGSNYQFLDYDQTASFMGSINASSNPSLLGAADTFHQGLDTQAVNASNVYNILACQNPGTFGQFRIYDGNKIEITAVDGDGTVPSISAENVGSSFTRQYFVLNSRKDHNDHTGLVRDAAGLALIQNIIAGQQDILPQEVSTSSAPCFATLPNPTTVIFSTHSPVDLHVYDLQNRHTGPTANDDQELGIPFSDYQKIGENSFISVPAGGTYRVVSQGLSSGSFDLDARIYNGGVLTNTATYLSVPLQSASTTAELDFSNVQNDMSLKVDTDGNGTTDLTLQPNAILSEAQSADITPPTISISSIASENIVGAPIVFNFSATDDLSGVAFVTSTLDGLPLANGAIRSDLNIGIHTLKVTAVDLAGNPTTKTLSFGVVYNFGGLLAPIKTDSSGIYKQGRTLPTKFQLTDAGGSFISTAIVNLFLSKVSDGIAGTEEVALSTSAADTGNQFRYDQTSSQYVFNLSLNLDIGTWRLKVALDDGKNYAVDISVGQ